ncbi:hypothetical protein Trydic_g14519 [Trypoxylus dichotomus]
MNHDLVGQRKLMMTKSRAPRSHIGEISVLIAEEGESVGRKTLPLRERFDPSSFVRNRPDRATYPVNGIQPVQPQR